MSDPSVPALAEGRWFWRRLYVFASTLVFWSLLTWSVSRTAAEHMAQVARGLMWLLGLVIVVYLIAPSAQRPADRGDPGGPAPAPGRGRAAMSFCLSARSRRALEGVHPDLVAVVEAAIQRTTVDFMVTEACVCRIARPPSCAQGPAGR